jgi:hypothetical protein
VARAALLGMLFACGSTPGAGAPADAALEAPVEAGGAGDGDDGSTASVPDAGEEPAWGSGVPCGAVTCSPMQYCLLYVPDAGPTPEAGDLSAQCVSLPASCAPTPTCSCIEPLAPCGAEFVGCVQAGGIAVTCTPP